MATEGEGRAAGSAQPGDTRAARLESLRLKRARALQSLQVACDRRLRAELEATLAALDHELSAMED